MYATIFALMAIHVFGLTGGIASGKSTVAARWRQQGLPVVNADELAREVVAAGSDGLDAVVQLMGHEVLQSDGTLDRRQIAKRVFSNPELRRALEALLHPRIQAALGTRKNAFEQHDEALMCYEAPLLVEVGRADLYRPLVVVTASEDLQTRRALARGDQSESEVRARIAAQLPMTEKANAADVEIANDGTLDQLHSRSDAALAEICRRLNADLSRYGLG